MGGGTPVDDIAHDDQKLEDRALELVRDPRVLFLILELNTI
jgi:hypothetical protein